MTKMKLFKAHHAVVEAIIEVLMVLVEIAIMETELEGQ
jgi:hypothetical protein